MKLQGYSTILGNICSVFIPGFINNIYVSFKNPIMAMTKFLLFFSPECPLSHLHVNVSYAFSYVNVSYVFSYVNVSNVFKFLLNLNWRLEF